MSASAEARECVPSSENEVAEVRAAMETTLLDNESARLKEVCQIKSHSGKLGGFCGLVNSKNEYAAYTGYKRFSALLNPARITIVPPSMDTSIEKGIYCLNCYDESFCRK